MRKSRQFVFIPITLIILIFVVFVFLMRNTKNLENPPQEIESNYIYILMKDNDLPFLDYEGDGFRKISSCNYIMGESGKIVPYKYECELIAMRIPEGEPFISQGINDDPMFHIIEIKGIVNRQGKNGFIFEGTMENKVPVKIQYVNIKTSIESEEEFPEFSFSVGNHKINYEGIIVGWLKD